MVRKAEAYSEGILLPSEAGASIAFCVAARTEPENWHVITALALFQVSQMHPATLRSLTARFNWQRCNLKNIMQINLQGSGAMSEEMQPLWAQRATIIQALPRVARLRLQWRWTPLCDRLNSREL